ncbi:hypothetical protein GOBAR_DD21441 [Gossypium barbadense]|nr:hypothetical protein GOBAR_DD21441 [Gossypium barbadense]
MSDLGKPVTERGGFEKLPDQLRDSLSYDFNKPDFRELDLGSPVSPLRTRQSGLTMTTTTSSSSSSSGSVSGRNGSIVTVGQVENARKHLCLLGQPQDRTELQKLQAVEKHLCKCTDARRIRDWKSALRETDAAIASGADFSPHLFMCRVEALLKLHQLDDAESSLSVVPKLEPCTNSCSQTKFFGMFSEAYLFFVQAQIEMALGSCWKRLQQIGSPKMLKVAVLLSKQRELRLPSSHGPTSQLVAVFKLGAGKRFRYYEVCEGKLPVTNKTLPAESSISKRQVALKKSSWRLRPLRKHAVSNSFGAAISLPGVSVVHFKMSSNMQAKADISIPWIHYGGTTVEAEESWSCKCLENITVSYQILKIYKKRLAAPSRNMCVPSRRNAVNTQVDYIIALTTP